MQSHINFIYSNDFKGSINAVVNEGKTPFILYDDTGAYARHFYGNEMSNCSAYRTEFNVKEFKKFLDSRLKACPTYDALIYVVGCNLKGLDLPLLVRAFNARCYFRILSTYGEPLNGWGRDELLTVYPTEREDGSPVLAGMSDEQVRKLKEYVQRYNRARA